jgi:hypothetical protein
MNRIPTVSTWSPPSPRPSQDNTGTDSDPRGEDELAARFWLNAGVISPGRVIYQIEDNNKMIGIIFFVNIYDPGYPQVYWRSIT